MAKLQTLIRRRPPTPHFISTLPAAEARRKLPSIAHRDMLVTSRNFAERVLGLRADDRMFSVSKLYFAYGLGNGMYFPLFFGASTVLYPDRPRPDHVAQIVAQYRPTVFFAVPTFYAALLREAEQGLHVDFSSDSLAVSAGESLPAEDVRELSRTVRNRNSGRHRLHGNAARFSLCARPAKRVPALAAAKFPATKRAS